MHEIVRMLRHTEGWTVAEAERGVEGMSGTSSPGGSWLSTMEQSTTGSGRTPM
jgi:hypothetical protein